MASSKKSKTPPTKAKAPSRAAKPGSKPVAKKPVVPAKPIAAKAPPKPLIKKPAPAPVKPVIAKPAIAAPKLVSLPRPSLAAQFSGATLGAKLPPRLQNLLDQNEIQQLLFTHCRALDRGEDNALRAVYHPDATLDLGPGIFQGTVTDYIVWIMHVLQQVKSSHTTISNCRIDVRGDEAFGEIYFVAQNRLDKPTGREDLFMAGRYLDRYERRPASAAGVWKIAHRKHVLDWVRTEPVADMFYHLNPDALWGQRNKSDMSYQLEQFPGGQASGGGKLPTFVGRRYEGKSIKL